MRGKPCASAKILCGAAARRDFSDEFKKKTMPLNSGTSRAPAQRSFAAKPHEEKLNSHNFENKKACPGLRGKLCVRKYPLRRSRTKKKHGSRAKETFIYKQAEIFNRKAGVCNPLRANTPAALVLKFIRPFPQRPLRPPLPFVPPVRGLLHSG